MNEQAEYMNFPMLGARISNLVRKLDDGTISRAELDELSNATLSLYERLVVIRYNTLRQEVQAATAENYTEPEGPPEEVEEQEVGQSQEVRKNPEQRADDELSDIREQIEHEVEMPGGSNFQLNFSQISPNQISLIDSIEEISREEKTRNETFIQDSPTLASKLQQKPIADLKSAIGINQKFLFISELFDNQSGAFADAIEKLNSCNSYLEADDYVENHLAPNYHWDMKSKTVKDLLELVQRRYL